MINATLDLYIFLHNSTTMSYEVVSVSSEDLKIPSLELTETTVDIDDLLKQMFEDHVLLSSNYVIFKISDTQIVDGILHISYYALTPYSTNVKNNSFLLPTNKYAILSKNIQKIINVL